MSRLLARIFASALLENEPSIVMAITGLVDKVPPMFADAIRYPFKGSGILIMIIGTVMAMMIQMASFIPIIGLIAMVLLIGYFSAYYYHTLQNAAMGRDMEPEWPDISDMLDDIGRPLFQVLGVFLVSNLLWLLAAWQMGESSLIARAAEVFGMFYFPMALLAVVMLGHLGGASPLLVLPSILKTFPLYALVAAAAVGLPFLVEGILRVTEGLPLIGWGLSTFFTLYLITAHARLLGLFYLKEQERLEWL